MTTYALIPGADGRGWFWHLVVPELRRRGHEAIAIDLPPEPTAGLEEYADAVVHAVDKAGPVVDDLVVVAHSLGAFTGPLVCERLPVRLLVLTNPMIPMPGETGNEWWTNTDQERARIAYAEQHGRSADFDVRRDFFHDVPPDVTEQAFAAGDEGSARLDTVFTQPWPLAEWPKLPIRVLQGEDDRFFPLEFQRRIALERLGMERVEHMPGGHLFALSRPVELADRLTLPLG